MVWGGRHEPAFPSADSYFDDGTAYDPVARTWRMLPAAPIGARAPLSVWTGEELIVWGNRTRDHRYVDGAAYDPATNTWRRIADGPIELTDATAVWTGRVMIVFGAALYGGNESESDTAIGAAYDPQSDTWERIADSELSPNASTAAWDGRHMIAWDYLNHTASYNWTTDTAEASERQHLDGRVPTRKRGHRTVRLRQLVWDPRSVRCRRRWLVRREPRTGDRRSR